MSVKFFHRAFLKFDAELNRIVEELASKRNKMSAGSASCDRIIDEMGDREFKEFFSQVMDENKRRKRLLKIEVAGVA